MKLTASLMPLDLLRDRLKESDQYSMYDDHLLPPNDQITFKYDFKDRYVKRGVQVWTEGNVNYRLEVVASDLSKQVVVTYRHYSGASYAGASPGMPFRVRWRLLAAPFKQQYWRWHYRIRRWSKIKDSHLG